MSQRTLAYIHLAMLPLLWGIAIYTNGLGGGGDSLTHYFMAKLSWTQPHYLLDLWGKPIFTMLSSPFAQFGFVGIKIFNVSCAVLASYFSCLSAKQLGKSLNWIILPLAFIAPAYYTYIFSGLTEPLAGMLGVMAVYLCLKGKITLGFLVASLLPFARTEAQIFLVFFLAFGLLNKHFKQIPLLLFGYILFSLIGGFTSGDFLWIFNSPYNSQGSVYGSGDWFHYFRSLKGMLGIPGITLACLGLLQFFWMWFQKKINWKTEPWLIHGLFFALFGGHTIVWALGIYGSAGLERTLLTVFPLLWIIMLDGVLFLQQLTRRISTKAALVIPFAILLIQGIYTYRDPVAGYYWQTHMTPGAEYHYFKNNVATYIKQNYPQAQQFVMDKPDMAVALGANFMDEANRLNWSYYHHPEHINDQTLWIFDSYYVPVQYGISLETINEEAKLKAVKSFDSPEGWHYVIYKKAQ